MSDALRLLREYWSRILLGISALIFLVTTVLPALNKMTDGFSAYYIASRLVLEHRAGAMLYDDDAFRVEVERLTHGRASDIFWANPPTTALLFLPLAWFSPVAARRIWIWLSLFFLVLAIELLRRAFSSSISTNTFWVAAIIFLLSAPLAKNFAQGQVYVFLLLLYVLTLLAMRANREWLAGFFLGLALIFKASGVPLLLLLAFHRRWRVVAWTILFAVITVILSLPLLGIWAWQVYLFQALPSFLSDPVTAVTAYQTLPGFIRHLFTYDSIWNPFPLLDASGFAILLSLLITFLFLFAAGITANKSSFEWTFCVGLLLSLILVPVAEGYHYVLSFPALLFAFSSIRSARVPLLVAAGLIVLPFSYTSTSLSQGWWALLAYPRLYGAVMLLAILLFNLYHVENMDASPRA